MKPERLGPSHPCLGCSHRGGHIMAERQKRLIPGHTCLHNHGRKDPICWGDPLPTWCPEPQGRK